jgi:hypothetical protein
VVSFLGSEDAASNTFQDFLLAGIAGSRLHETLVTCVSKVHLGSSKPQQVGHVASRREMLGIDGLESILLVQGNRLSQPGIRYQPDLAKPTLLGGRKQVFQKSLS